MRQSASCEVLASQLGGKTQDTEIFCEGWQRASVARFWTTEKQCPRQCFPPKPPVFENGAIRSNMDSGSREIFSLLAFWGARVKNKFGVPVQSQSAAGFRGEFTFGLSATCEKA